MDGKFLKKSVLQNEGKHNVPNSKNTITMQKGMNNESITDLREQK